MGAAVVGAAFVLAAVPASASYSIGFAEGGSELQVAQGRHFEVEIANTGTEDGEVTLELTGQRGVTIAHDDEVNEAGRPLVVETVKVPAGETALVDVEAEVGERPESGKVSVRACVVDAEHAPVVCTAEILDVAAAAPKEPNWMLISAGATLVLLGTGFAMFLVKRRGQGPAA